MVTSNYVNRTVNKSLYIILPLLLISIFVFKIFFAQTSSYTSTTLTPVKLSPVELLPIQPAIASTNSPFPSAQFNNSPIGFELYDSISTSTFSQSKTTYVSRGNNYALFLTPSEAVVTLSNVNNNVNSNLNDNLKSNGIETSVLHMQFVGANKSTKISGVDGSRSKSHYFIGNDPSRWKTDVPRYKKVQYKDLYPGIDLMFYGNQSQLEYDFIVAPNVNPDIIRLNFTGSGKSEASELETGKLEINNQGDLLIQTRIGHVLQKKPVIYQINQNSKRKQFIEGSYVLLNDNTLGFNIGDYNPKLPLIIDPILDYAIYIGGSDQDNGTRIAVDTNGYIYITGFTFSSDFPGGALLGSNISSFVTKLTPDGSNIIFSVYLGGSGVDRSRDIAINDNGDIYVVGETTSTDFPVLDAPPSRSQNKGDADAFLAVISNGGTHLHYSTYFGGSGYDAAQGLAIGNNDQVYIAGETWSNDLPVTPNALDNTCGTGTTCVTNKNYDAFFTVIDIFANELVYSTYLGGGGDDKAHAVAVHLNTGYGYMAGETNSIDFPREKSILPIIGYQGDHLQGFLTVIDPHLDSNVSNLNSRIFSSLLGGEKEDVVNSITVDTSGHAYLFGYTNSIDFPVKNAYQGFLRGNTDSFIAKINPAAVTGPEALIYATYLGGSGADLSYGVAVDDLNRTYLVGTTSSMDFPTVAAFQNSNAGGIDAYVATLSADGDALHYASYLGGTGNETGSGIAVSEDGTAYIVGDSMSSNLPATTSYTQYATDTNNDSINAFVAKVSPPDNLPSDNSAPAKGSSGGGAGSPAFFIVLMIFLFVRHRKGLHSFYF